MGRDWVAMVASNTHTRKAKGRNFQQYVRDRLREHYTGKLVAKDIESRQMGGAGTDIVLSPLAEEYFPYDVEIKNQETWSVPQWWKQAYQNTQEGRKPLLVMKKNHHEPLVVMKFGDFMEMLQ